MKITSIWNEHVSSKPSPNRKPDDIKVITLALLLLRSASSVVIELVLLVA